MNTRKFVMYLLLILFSLNFAYSQYYADIEIFVEDTGSVTIGGITNNNELQNITNSQVYTSKKGEYWLLNITTTEKFDNFIYELNLPQNSQINYIKTTPTFRIEQDSSNLKIIGTGENKPLTIIVQYKINPSKSPIFSINSIITIFIIVALLILISITIIFTKIINKAKEIVPKIDNQSNSVSNTNNNLSNKHKIHLENLPDRQQDIIKLIIKNKKMTQKQLEDNMHIPKSSVSRNVSSLVAKKILVKEKAGQSNYITINQDLEIIQ